MRLLSRTYLLLMSGGIMISCIDELDLVGAVDDEGKGLLVVEASFTNEIKRQEVYLSRTEQRFDLETDTVYNPFIPLGRDLSDSINFETDARLTLIGSDGSEYNFVEEENGTYLSEMDFAVQNGIDYQLEITTSDGTDYLSERVGIVGESSITEIYAERTLSDTGVDGIQIFIDSQPVNGSPDNFRYTYEETYKVIAPFWDNQDFLLTNYDPCALPEPTYDLEIIEREIQNQTCYNTVESNTIIQTSLNNNSNDVLKFPIRFIGRDNFIISHRYSILVKQHVQSIEAFSFYETVREFSQSENLFSQIQPGALTSNVKRRDGGDENILGYVEAVSVSERRLFFDFEDFFPGEELPPYPFNCSLQSTPESHPSYCATGPVMNSCPQSIIERVDLGVITHVGNNDDNIGSCPGPYTFVARICGDCTLLGENTVPEFWIEE